VEDVRCGVIRTGDGTVRAAHGILPVPAPATLKLLEGHRVSPGPDGAGELVDADGCGARTRAVHRSAARRVHPTEERLWRRVEGLPRRANALRIVLADVESNSDGSAPREALALIAADLDDMSPEYLAAVADRARAEGALDVVLIPVSMKKGRRERESRS
jgi:uncharacterized protein (DUF111 family)